MKKKILVIVILIIMIAGIIWHFYNRGNSIITTDEWLYTPKVYKGNSVSSKGITFFGATSDTASKGITSFAETSSESTLGYSTGGAKNAENFRENIKNGYFPLSTDLTYNGLFYNYSFDTGNTKVKSDELFYPSYTTAISKDIYSEEAEYYMSVGLNSNINENDFKRQKLNLVVVLDNSGSMSSRI